MMRAPSGGVRRIAQSAALWVLYRTVMECVFQFAER
jgi:hypothetical protein